MNLNLKNKVVIVTGASRGIGKAIALGFAVEGTKLSICGRTPETLESAVNEIQALGEEVFAKPTDVTHSTQAEAFVKATLDKYGCIDVLVNNVGGSRKTPTLEISDEEWHDLLDLNAISAARMSRLVIPTMKQQGGGVILMISSIYGRESGGHITYNAGKAAEISIAKSLAMELAPYNIRVNSVAPGSTMFPGGSWERKQKADPTKIAAFIKSDLPFGRFGRPEEIANVVVFLASERASLVTGACINVDGCQSRSNI
ncbi:MAG: SDR family NAD(P)-dependent oxidoreductase [bacterium]